MTGGDMIRADRDAPLPDQMQGRWVFEGEPESEIVIRGGKISCLGQAVDYDYKEIGQVAGALTVNLCVEEGKDQDYFQRANVTGLVITAEGDFLGYNVKWSARFERVEADPSLIQGLGGQVG
jgi:hypothetical protein